jgi:hypothetical protein
MQFKEIVETKFETQFQQLETKMSQQQVFKYLPHFNSTPKSIISNFFCQRQMVRHLEIKNRQLEEKVIRLESKVQKLESSVVGLQENRKSIDPLTGRSAIPRTCREAHLADPSLDSGMRWIDPDGQGVGDDPIYVHCDMTTGTTDTGKMF